MAPCEESLEDGLVLRSVRHERDVERYVALNRLIWGDVEAWTTHCLLDHHPEIVYDSFQYVEDERSGEMLSTTCLIPWHWRYEDIDLDVAMLEMVGTHPQHRQRGLIRAQVRRFHRMLDERGCDLSIIEGIPYYYRQFGYGYAIDHRPSETLAPWCVPPATEGEAQRYRLRPASLDDVPALARCYDEAIAPVPLSEVRSADYWRFLLRWVRYPARMVEDRADGRTLGYVVTGPLAGQRGTHVVESAIASAEAALEVLRLLRAETDGELRLAGPETSALVQLGRSLGSIRPPQYQWLVRIRDVGQLLARLRPVLERRVAESPWAGLTRDICLNLYRQAYLLRFTAGRLAVEPMGFVDASMGADGGDIRVPPEAFPRLVFGQRSLAELLDAWPDAGAKPDAAYLLEVLFPRMVTCFWAPYLYCGPLPPMHG